MARVLILWHDLLAEPMLDRLRILAGGLPKSEEGAQLFPVATATAAFQRIVKPGECRHLQLPMHISRRNWVFPPLLPINGRVEHIMTCGLGRSFTTSRAIITAPMIDTGEQVGGGKRLIEKLATHQPAFEPPASSLFITLTYGRDYDDWATAKKHLEALRAYMTRHWGDLLTGYWVVEAQERGAPRRISTRCCAGWGSRRSSMR